MLLVLSLIGADICGEQVEQTVATGDTLVEVIEDSSRYVVSIDRVTIGDMRINDTLGIFLNSFGNPVAAFELKIAVESPFIDIDTVLPGEIPDSCGWEFFNARPVNTQGEEGYPPIVWQVVALAELGLGGTQPVCYGFERPASLVKLVVSSEHVAQVPDTVVPIFFLWEDCTDNTISGISGNTLILSAQVFDYFGSDFMQERGLFPNRTGAPNQCIDPSAQNKPRRLIEFHNGGVEFKLDLGEGIVDSADTFTE